MPEWVDGSHGASGKTELSTLNLAVNSSWFEIFEALEMVTKLKEVLLMTINLTRRKMMQAVGAVALVPSISESFGYSHSALEFCIFTIHTPSRMNSRPR